MMRLVEATGCVNCQEYMPPGTRVTHNEDGELVHADGCMPDYWAAQMQPAGALPRVEGKYRGPQRRRARVCPDCHLVGPCDCE